MAEAVGAPGAALLAPSGDARVWGLVKRLYLAAAGLVLVNITLGFLNIAQSPGLPRWMLLTHLHAATIGWITVSAVATSIWWFAGPRFKSGFAWLGWGAVAAAAGYIFSFAAGFSQGGVWWTLLPVFGVATATVILATFAFVAVRLFRLPTVTTPHLLVAGALLLAGMGAVMGVLFGLQYALNHFFLQGMELRVHAFTMDIYALVLGLAFLEALVVDASRARWSGVAQAALLAGGFALFTVGGITGVGVLEGVGFPVFLLGAVFFLARIGWRPVLCNPFRPGAAHPFWGAVFVVLFFAVLLRIGIWGGPEWLGVAFMHFLYVGVVTNATLGLIGATIGARGWLEPFAAWILSLGVLTFIAGLALADRADGAAVMGIGFLTALLPLMGALWRSLGSEPDVVPPVAPT